MEYQFFYRLIKLINYIITVNKIVKVNVNSSVFIIKSFSKVISNEYVFVVIL